MDLSGFLNIFLSLPEVWTVGMVRLDLGVVLGGSSSMMEW